MTDSQLEAVARAIYERARLRAFAAHQVWSVWDDLVGEAEEILDEYRDLADAVLAVHPVATEAADLRLSENGWLYQQHSKCDCAGPSMFTSAHEYTCAKEPLVNLTELPGWDEMLATHQTPTLTPTVAEYEAAYPDGITQERSVSDVRDEAIESLAETAWRSSKKFNWVTADSWDKVDESKRDRWRYIAEDILDALPAQPASAENVDTSKPLLALGSVIGYSASLRFYRIPEDAVWEKRDGSYVLVKKGFNRD